MTTLVTGAAGFIGMHLARRLREGGERVVAVDDFNAYYDPALKEARAALLAGIGCEVAHLDVADAQAFANFARKAEARRIVHLAAQAGVRYSLDNPGVYGRANVMGHLSVLEACRAHSGLEHLVYASSSSVYGDRPLGEVGFSETDPVDQPASLYAATKRACELMSTTYSGLFGLAQTGLRFFTVYGPWGRPDMAYWKFTKSILGGEPIEVFGEGRMARDFTYVDDVVDGIVGVLDRPPARGENRILNIGDSSPVALMDMIALLEKHLGREARKIMRPMQPGDVTATFADISRIHALTGYKPRIDLEEGLRRFVEWWFERQGPSLST